MPILKNFRSLQLIALVAISIFLSACNIQKHYHSSGFHLDLMGKAGRNDLPVGTQGRQSVKMRQGQSPIAREKKDAENESELKFDGNVETASCEQVGEIQASADAIPHATEGMARKDIGKSDLGKTFTVGMNFDSPKSTAKSLELSGLRNEKDPEPVIELILLILALCGIGSYSGYSGGGGYAGRSNVDWTVVFSIAAAVIGVAGLITILAVRKTMDSATLSGILVFFGVIGAPVGIIGLIKSIRDYYDVGIWLSAGGLGMLALMFLVGLV